MKTLWTFIGLACCLACSLSCEGPAGPQGPPGDPYGALSDPSVMPKVIYTYPGANTAGPYDELYHYECGFEFCQFYSQFQLRFNKFMNISSVRRAVGLKSAYGDIFSDTSFMVSVGGDVFILDPVNEQGYRYNFRPRIGATYSITVDSTARDINGNAFAPPFTASFVLEPYFRVMETGPREGETDVSVYSNPTLIFNAKVTASILSHAAISPAIPGTWWVGYDSTAIGYQPASNLPAGTSFTMSLDAGAEDVDGNRLTASFALHFTTIAFKVIDAFPDDGAVGVPLNTTASVLFSVPLDTSGMRAAFHISPPTAGTIGGVYYGTTGLTFAPAGGFLALRAYTVHIDNTIRSLAGDPLPAPFEFTFTTGPFSVISTSPLDGATGVTRHTVVTINTNAPLEMASVAGAVALTPPVPVSFSICDGCGSFYFFAPDGFEANTSYTVTLGTNLTTKRGEPLPAPYSFSFKTGPN